MVRTKIFVARSIGLFGVGGSLNRTIHLAKRVKESGISVKKISKYDA